MERTSGLGSKGQVEGRTWASECEMNSLQNLSLHLCSMRISLDWFESKENLHRKPWYNPYTSRGLNPGFRCSDFPPNQSNENSVSKQRRGVSSCRTTALGCSRQVPRRTTFQRFHWVLSRWILVIQAMKINRQHICKLQVECACSIIFTFGW